MSTRLVILGLLREQPLYGYEIKQIIEEHMGDWTSIAFGSIYFALDKLASEGLIEKVAVEQPGSRPSRSVYQITPNGREEFLQLLRAVWNEVEPNRFSIDIGLFFISALPVEEIKVSLRARVAYLEKALRHVSAHEEEEMQDERIPSIATAIFAHTLVHLHAELAWTRELLQKAEQNAF